MSNATSVPASTDTPASSATGYWWRGRLALVCLFLVALTFIQEPGRIVTDTKLDLSINPQWLLTRGFRLWDSQAFSGQLANQTYGYLWPLGPFHWIGQTLGLPAWAVQRLWWSLLLCVGFLGMVKLASLLGISNRPARVLGALAFIFAPRLVSSLGAISIESWPTMLAPWVLIPLVRGSTSGNPRRWGLLSALAFGCIGGVNAVATWAVLPLGVVWLVTRPWSRRVAALAGWWALGIVLASLWFVVPLVMLGRYSPPFLDWIEAAAITTSITSPERVLRGVVAWLPYLADGNGPVLPSGWYLIASAAGIVASGLVAATGAAGLVLRTTPQRTFLMASALLGFALVSLGHVGDLPGFGAETIRGLLDGVLAPFRNVHKFDVILRLPLSLGFMVAIAALVTGASQWSAAGQRTKASGAGRTLALVGSSALVALAALPVLGGGLAAGRSFNDVPNYWRDASAWLQDQPDSRALVVPASSFATFLWGRTNDEPFQALGETAWSVRDAVPLSTAGNIRLLDEISAQLESGRGSDQLAALLGRAGFTHVVLRNDLDPGTAETPRSTVLRSALTQSPGLGKAAVFGIGGGLPAAEDVVVSEGLDGAYPPVEVFAVDQALVTGPTDVVVRDASAPVRVLGGAEAVAGVAAVAGTVVISGDPGTQTLPGGVVLGTDTLRKQEVNFGRVRSNRSETMTEAGEYAADRPVHDYIDRPDLGQSVAQYSGGVNFQASSSASDPNAIGEWSLAAQPAAAVDGDPATSWQSSAAEGSVGQWWQIDFATPIDLPDKVTVQVRGGPDGAPPTAVQVTTDAGTVRSDLPATSAGESLTADLAVVPGVTKSMRITAVQMPSDELDTGFGIAEVDLPIGVVERTVVTLPGAADGWIFRATPGGRDGCVAMVERLLCSSQAVAAGEEDAGIDRVITVPADTPVTLTATVAVRSGAAAVSRVTPVPTTTAQASSVLGNLPGAGGGMAVDGDQSTAWIADPDDDEPFLEVSWPTPQLITGVQVRNATGLNASAPLEATLTTDDGTQRTVLFTEDGFGELTSPLSTRTLRLTVDRVYTTYGVSAEQPNRTALSVGISEVEFLGAAAPAEAADTLTTWCGEGPTLLIDEQPRLWTSVNGDLRAAQAGQPLSASGCALDGSAEAQVTLPAGVHRIQFAATEVFTPLTLDLLPVQPPGAPPAVLPTTAFADDARTVQIPPAPITRTLELPENFNEGWTAILDGAELTPVRVDGWRQAWVLPADSGGTVTMTFTPQRPYLAGLGLGALAAAVLVALAAWRGPNKSGERAAQVGTAGSESGTVADPHWVVRATWLLGVCVVALAGGVVGLGAMALGWLLGRRVSRLWLLTGGAAVAATVLQLPYPWPAASDQPWWVGAVAAVAVFILIGSWLAALPGGTRKLPGAPRRSN